MNMSVMKMLRRRRALERLDAQILNGPDVALTSDDRTRINNERNTLKQRI